MSKSRQLGIAFSALLVSVGFAWIFCTYVAIPEQPKESCWYEIKYLHVSGREITKRVYATCGGFHHWYGRERYKIFAMVLPFSDSTSIKIQGATDILSDQKIKNHEQQQ